MKLELKYLAGYLPYGLKFYVFDKPSFEKKYLEMHPNGNSRVEITIENIKEKIFKNGYKPILRPLSDLTNFCEDLGFVPIEELDDLESDVCSYSLDYYINHTNRLPFYRVQKLLEWNFDIHNLIENNLAIDINTL